MCGLRAPRDSGQASLSRRIARDGRRCLSGIAARRAGQRMVQRPLRAKGPCRSRGRDVAIAATRRHSRRAGPRARTDREAHVDSRDRDPNPCRNHLADCHSRHRPRRAAVWHRYLRRRSHGRRSCWDKTAGPRRCARSGRRQVRLGARRGCLRRLFLERRSCWDTPAVPRRCVPSVRRLVRAAPTQGRTRRRMRRQQGPR